MRQGSGNETVVRLNMPIFQMFLNIFLARLLPNLYSNSGNYGLPFAYASEGGFQIFCSEALPRLKFRSSGHLQQLSKRKLLHNNTAHFG